MKLLEKEFEFVSTLIKLPRGTAADTADGDIRPTTLQDTATQDITFGVSDPPSSINPVAPNCEDESIAAVVAKRKPIVSSVSQFSVPRVLFPWEKLTKAIVFEVFKDVHTGLRTLGLPLHISMNAVWKLIEIEVECLGPLTELLNQKDQCVHLPHTRAAKMKARRRNFPLRNLFL